MATEEECPDCLGTGLVEIGPTDPIFGPDVEFCWFCLGKGTISVPDPCEYEDTEDE